MSTDPRGAAETKYKAPTKPAQGKGLAPSPLKAPSFRDAPTKGPPHSTHDPHAPVPILAAHGFTGGIQSWNQRVQKTVDAYQAQHGRRPSPGLVFDVARSAHVIDGIIQPPLFDVAQTSMRANMRAAQAKESLDGKIYSVRPDGNRDPDNHYKSIIPLIDHPSSDYSSYQAFQTAKDFKYSMVPLGSLAGAAKDYVSFWKDVAITVGQHRNPAIQGQYPNGMSLQEADKIVKSHQYRAGRGGPTPDITSPLAKAVHNIGGVQDTLIKMAPYKFAGLPVTGYMTPDWIRAYSSWSRSDDFGMQNLKYLAKQNSFPQDDRGIADMNKAFHYKLTLLNDPKEAPFARMIQSVPLRVIADMNFKYGFPHDPAQFLKNSWSYMRAGTSSNPVIGGLQTAFHGLKEGMSLLGGAYQQTKQDALVTTSVINELIDSATGGKHMTRDQAAALVTEKFKENPTWAKIVTGGLVTDKNEPGWAKNLDQASNFIVDMTLGMKIPNPRFAKLALTKDAAESSTAVYGSATLAYNAILHNDLELAVRELHGGRGAEALVSESHKWIATGKMTPKEFHSHVTDMYGEFHTTIGENEIHGHVLSDYSSPVMRSPGRLGITTQKIVHAVNYISNDIERAALNNRANGVIRTGNAEKMIRGTRSMIDKAVPVGSKEMWGPQFPRNMKTFLIGKGVMTRVEATALTNKFIKARAKEDVGAMNAIFTEAHDAFRAKYPAPPGQVEPSIFEPAVETEQLSRANFPSGGRTETYKPKEGAVLAAEAAGVPSPMVEFAGGAVRSVNRMVKEPVGGSIDLANRTNDLLNKITQVWRSIILIKNVGRAWKHALRDNIAFVLGGGNVTGLSKDARFSQAEAKNYIDMHNDLFRQFSTARGRSAYSELHWLAGDHWVDGQNAWNLGDYLGKDVPRVERNVRITGAVEYVRKMMTSDAYEAYMKTTRADKGALVDEMIRNPRLKQVFWQRQLMTNKFREALGGMKSEGISTKHQLTLDEEFAGRQKMGDIQLDEAHKYAEKLFNKYFELEEAVVQSGGSMDEVWKIIHQNPGLSDSELGKYLTKNQVPVKVHDGTMVIKGMWDKVSENIISQYMRPNFWARKNLFDQTFANLYHDFRTAGMDQRTAVQAASHTAERVTVKHMLDFTNQLQAEQKFRWLLPFFTKHRLYVGWLINVARQYPALALPITDVGNALDPAGNVNFDMPGLGPMKINMLRMMWLNTEDQPATIPAAALIPGAEHFSGNESIGQAWFGGTGEAVKSLYKSFSTHTYEGAIKGMSPTSVKQIDKLMVSYGIHYQDTHPGMPIPEGAAVKYALQRYSYMSLTNDTMFTPVTFQGAQLPSDIQKLSDQYTKLYADDPAKAADFLDKNPRVGLAFGVYKDTNVFWHEQAMFKKLKQINAKRDAVETPLVAKFQKSGVLTNDDLQAMRQARRDYSKDYHDLLVQDAQQWQHTDIPGFPPGVVKKNADGSLRVVTAGPFGAGSGVSNAAQALDDWMIKTFPNLKKSALLKVWSDTQDTMQARLDQIPVNPTGPDAQVLKDERTYLNKALAPYRDISKDPAGKVISAYFTAREKWFNQAIPLRAELKTASGSHKAEIQDQLRLLDAQSIIDSSFKYKGHTYKGPAFAVSSYNDQPEPQRLAWFLTNIVNASYENQSSTDKIITGVGNSDPVMDAAWVAYHTMAREYADGQRADYKGPQSGYKQYYAGVINQKMVAAGHPGFMSDWLNSTKPKYQLVTQYAPLKQSHYQAQWTGLLAIANSIYSRTSGWKETQRVEYWQYHVAPAVLEALKSEPQGFQDELAVAGGQKFIWSLMSSANKLTGK